MNHTGRIEINKLTDSVLRKALNFQGFDGDLPILHDDLDMGICVVETEQGEVHPWPVVKNQDEIEDLYVTFLMLFKNVNKIHLHPIAYSEYNNVPKERVTV